MCTRNHGKGVPRPGRGAKGLQKLILAPSLAYKAAVEQTLNSIVPNRSVLSSARSTEEVPVGSGRTGSGIIPMETDTR